MEHMKKKYVIALTLISVLVVGALRMNYINAGNAPEVISKDQIFEETKVTDEEKEILEKNGISYDDVISEAESMTSLLFDHPDTFKLKKPDRAIFYEGGAMETGRLDGEGSYIADGVTGVFFARFNPATDPNSVDMETARYLYNLQNIRFVVDENLKNCK